MQAFTEISVQVRQGVMQPLHLAQGYILQFGTIAIKSEGSIHLQVLVVSSSLASL